MTTTQYCSRADVENRLSAAGVAYVADDNLSGTATEPELVSTSDEAIAWAGSAIDAALEPWLNVVPISQDDANRNAWLKFRAIDLALEHLAGRRGGNIPESIRSSADRVRMELEQVRRGDLRVPGLTYPVDNSDVQRVRDFGRPRICND